jgi:hypothetical protein
VLLPDVNVLVADDDEVATFFAHLAAHPQSGRGGAIVTAPRPSTSPSFTAYALECTMAA